MQKNMQNSNCLLNRTARLLYFGHFEHQARTVKGRREGLQADHCRRQDLYLQNPDCCCAFSTYYVE